MRLVSILYFCIRGAPRPRGCVCIVLHVLLVRAHQNILKNSHGILDVYANSRNGY